MGKPDDIVHDVSRAADRLRTRLAKMADATANPEYRDLLHVVRELDPGFAFDREGRPAAIDAVRNALPAMERDLFDAIIEDFTCELAAAEEALYQVARAGDQHSS
jgi:hypothetical protein